jgi:hypothetical protein
MNCAELFSPQEGDNGRVDLERWSSSRASSSSLRFCATPLASLARLFEIPAILYFFENSLARHGTLQATDRSVDTARVDADFKGAEFIVVISSILECHRSILSFDSAYAFIQNISV